MGLSPPCHHRVGSKRFSLEAYRYTCSDEKYYLRRMLVTRDKLNPTRRFLQVRISNCLIGNYSELKLIINYRKCKNVRGNKSLVINKPRPTCTNVYFSCNRSFKRYLACILRGAWQGCVKQCARLCACIRCFLSNASEPTTDFVSYSFARHVLATAVTYRVPGATVHARTLVSSRRFIMYIELSNFL